MPIGHTAVAFKNYLRCDDVSNAGLQAILRFGGFGENNYHVIADEHRAAKTRRQLRDSAKVCVPRRERLNAPAQYMDTVNYRRTTWRPPCLYRIYMYRVPIAG